MLFASHAARATRRRRFATVPPESSTQTSIDGKVDGIESTVSSEPPPQSSNSSKPIRRFRMRNIIYATVFLLSGLTIGQLVRFTVLPPPLPIPGSEEDIVYLTALHRDADRLPIVEELRLHPDEWIETEAYNDKGTLQRQSSLTAGAMSGSRGLAVQKIFWNEQENRSLGVVFFGGALSGWPGVTHGGCIATVMQEHMERLVANLDGGFARPDGLAISLEMTYRKPTLANRFHLIRAEVEESDAHGQAEWPLITKAVLEDIDTGLVLAEASARCVRNTHESSRVPQSVQNQAGESLSAWISKALSRIFG